MKEAFSESSHPATFGATANPCVSISGGIMVRTLIIALSVLFVFTVGVASSVAAPSVADKRAELGRPRGSPARESVSFDALRLGIAVPSHESSRAPDGYDCDASLQKRLAIGAVTGAIVGTAMYFAFTAIVPKGTGNRGR